MNKYLASDAHVQIGSLIYRDITNVLPVRGDPIPWEYTV